MAPGGHSNRLSCCCNKVYFLLKHLVLCLRLSGWRSRPVEAGRAQMGRPLGGPALLRSGAGRAQVELPAASRKLGLRSAWGRSRSGLSRRAEGAERPR